MVVMKEDTSEKKIFTATESMITRKGIILNSLMPKLAVESKSHNFVGLNTSSAVP